MNTWAVVLAGGVGSRFWPLSTPRRPKQLLPLVSPTPLLVESIERLHPLVDPAHVLVLTNTTLAQPTAGLLPAVPAENIIAEPKAGGTAAALTWAAKEIARRDGPDCVMVSIHADWSVRDVNAFRTALSRAVRTAAEHHVLVTVGVKSSRLDPGFGFIKPGAEIEPGVRRVARFIEKPDVSRAREMTQAGELWNTGIFAWRVGDFLDDVRQYTPEVASALHSHANDIRAFFHSVTPVAVDVGVLERSNRVVVLAGDFGWDDVGTWGRLRGVRAHDAHGNAIIGDVHAVESRGNVVHAEGATVVLYGVDDLVVVVREGVTLVTTVERSGEIRHLLDRLPRDIVDRQ
jgi:mannose-1-phosphate guanylyltransferase